jgi:hypothetical protein
MTDSKEMIDLCRSMFERHRVTAFDGVFHVPDVTRYPALFAWDSGYHALAIRHFDPDLAASELSTLYRSNLLPDGLLSHQRFVPGAEDAQALVEELFGPMFHGDRTSFVDPPTPAYASARLSNAGTASEDLLDVALGHLRALARLRTLDGGVLPVTLHPFETGTEGSVYVNTVLGGPMDTTFGRFRDLTVSAVDSEMSPERALARGHGFVVIDPTMCGWYLLALEEAAAACRTHGRAADATWADDTAEAVADELVARLWWPEGHVFVAYDMVGKRQLPGLAAMGLVPAASAILAARGISADVAEHHVHEGSPLWGPRGLAAGTVSPGTGVRSFVQWDGNAVWGATVYWAHLVALRSGLTTVARALRSQLEDLVRAHGFREFYDAWSGEPGGAGAESGFTWPALVLEMESNEGS